VSESFIFRLPPSVLKKQIKVLPMQEEKKPYRVGYASSGRSMCKKCQNYIKQDTLRIGKMVQSTKFDGEFPIWFHFKCFFQSYGKQASDIALFHGIISIF
jgi:hypothetical protein